MRRGIPAGTKLAFNVLYATDPVIFGEQLTAWASDAKKVGINITLQSGTFNHVITVADDPGSPKTINQWAVAVYGGFTDAYYPTTMGIFNTGGSFNGGFYTQPPGGQADHRVDHQRQPRRGQGGGVLPHPGAAQPVPAQLRLHHRVEEQRVRPAGRVRGDDPVRPQHGADVPDQLTGSLERAGWEIHGRQAQGRLLIITERSCCRGRWSSCFLLARRFGHAAARISPRHRVPGGGEAGYLPGLIR